MASAAPTPRVLRPAALKLTPLQKHLLDAGAECHRCPLGRNGVPSRPVSTDWPHSTPPLVALVGEAPGKREVQHGKPFVGPSGNILNQLCRQANVPRGGLAIMNATACGPIPSDADAVKIAAADACRPRLLAELRALRPKVLMAVGAQALRSLAPHVSSGVTVLRGAKLTPANDVAPEGAPLPTLFATFHPAHVMRGGDEEQKDGGNSKSVDVLYFFMLYDIGKAWRYARKEMLDWRDELDLFVHDGFKLRRATTGANGEALIDDIAHPKELVDAIERVHAEAKKHNFGVFDVETDGKDSLEANLTAIGIASKDGAMSATWQAFLKIPAAFRAMKAFLGDTTLPKGAHNKIYDCCVCPRHGLPVAHPVEDTLLKHHAALPGLPHKLQQVVAQFCIVPPWKDEFRHSSKNPAELALYNARDCLATALVDDPLNSMLKHHKVERVYAVDRQLMNVATYMRQVGFFVDRDEQRRQSGIQHARLEHMRQDLEKRFAAIEEPWRQTLAREMAGKQRKNDPDDYLERVAIRYQEIAKRKPKPTDVGMFKPKAKLDLVALYQVLGIPFSAYTKSGLGVTDKKSMEVAAGRHPLMRSLIHIREAQHLIATYIDGLPVKVDGRAHPDWSFKITGRWGAGKSQNVPKQVASWPPFKNEDGTFKRKKSGDYDAPIENPRSIIVAPTVAQVLALHAAGGRVHPQILARAKRGKGRRLFGADYSQQELRIAALLSRDKFLLDIFAKPNPDPHAEFARICFPKQFPLLEAELTALGIKKFKAEISEEMIAAAANDIERARLQKAQKLQMQWAKLRDISKTGEFGGIYGATWERIFEELSKKFPETEPSAAQQLHKLVNEKLTGVVAWRNKVEGDARYNREIREALLGRVRLFPLGTFNPNIVYNFPIQAFGASLMAFAIFRFVALTHPELLEFGALYKHGLLDPKWVEVRKREGFGEWNAPCDLLINGHDSLVGECDEDDAVKAGKLLDLAMTQEHSMGGITMRFPADPKTGYRWSEV